MARWYHNPIIYQVYLASFKDKNNDGVGDICGLISKLDYFTYLKVDTLLLSPLHPSPQKDNGFDITNYEEIDPCYGTVEDFDCLIQEARKKDMHILMNFVPNHTSDQHEWFERSVRRIDPYTDYYIWRDPVKGPTGRKPPNNWLSVFGGSAWTWNKKRKQYYLHQFLPEQPDLNLRNQIVREELRKILMFWLEKGVDGFRVDAASHLFEHESFRDEPQAEFAVAEPGEYDYLDHIYSKGQPENLQIIGEWRAILDEYSEKSGDHKFLLAEAYEDCSSTMRYYGQTYEPLCDFPLNPKLIDLGVNSDPHTLLAAITEWMDAMPEGKIPNWLLGSHDHPRLISRVGPLLIDGLHMISLMLQGIAVCYYGDELGMQDVPISIEDMKDTGAHRTSPEESRDRVRTPMQWNCELNAGFTLGKPWLPVGQDYDTVNVEAQKECANSHLQIFRKLVGLRRELAVQSGFQIYPMVNDDIFSMARVLQDCKSYLVIFNMSGNECIINFDGTLWLPKTAYLEISNQTYCGEVSCEIDLHMLSLKPYEALVVSFSTIMFTC